MTRKIIVIDGLAGTGKTSLAKMLAEKLGYVHLNSGTVYRGVGLLALDNKIPTDDEAALEKMLSEHVMELVLNDKGESRLLIDSSDVGDKIFTREVSQAASQIAALPKVREFLQAIQRSAFPSAKGLVADGRDMGTVLFPDADFKFFVKVDSGIRAERRVAQLYPDQKDANELERLKKELLTEIDERDMRDVERDIAPTIPADDAIIIDNTQATLTQTLENMYYSIADDAG